MTTTRNWDATANDAMETLQTAVKAREDAYILWQIATPGTPEEEQAYSAYVGLITRVTFARSAWLDACKGPGR